jgi:hypothetical protein
MRSIQAGALAGGYVDIEYSYVIDNPDATVFESRGPAKNSAATADHNSISHAICVMGNFETEAPADRVLSMVAQLTAWGHEKGWWPAQITGPHRDVYATACCGAQLIAQIGEINSRARSGASAPPPPKSKKGGAVNIARTKSGKGYWICAADGGVFTYGDAQFYGSMGGKKLNAPVVGMAAAADGKGYALVASDGGVFAFGSVVYKGGMGGEKINAPVVAIEMDADGLGYWLLAADGGVFAFGAGFYGNATKEIDY